MVISSRGLKGFKVLVNTPKIAIVGTSLGLRGLFLFSSHYSLKFVSKEIGHTRVLMYIKTTDLLFLTTRHLGQVYLIIYYLIYDLNLILKLMPSW